MPLSISSRKSEAPVHFFVNASAVRPEQPQEQRTSYDYVYRQMADAKRQLAV